MLLEGGVELPFLRFFASHVQSYLNAGKIIEPSASVRRKGKFTSIACRLPDVHDARVLRSGGEVRPTEAMTFTTFSRRRIDLLMLTMPGISARNGGSMACNTTAYAECVAE